LHAGVMEHKRCSDAKRGRVLWFEGGGTPAERRGLCDVVGGVVSGSQSRKKSGRMRQRRIVTLGVTVKLRKVSRWEFLGTKR